MNIIDHLELYLGEIDVGYQGDDSTPAGMQVVRFGPNSPFEGATTLVTLGLCRSHLSQPTGAALHQELLLHFRNDRQPGNAPAILFQVSAELIRRGVGLHRGDVLGPRGSLFGRGHASALYAAAPMLLPDDFAVYREGEVSVVLTWLVPITEDEAAFVRSHGCDAFESVVVDNDADLTNVDRPSVFDRQT